MDESCCFGEDRTTKSLHINFLMSYNGVVAEKRKARYGLILLWFLPNLLSPPNLVLS